MKTFAVVIGINKYLGEARLKNAVNDATAMADVFRRLSYEVLSETNCNTEKLDQMIDEYKDRVNGFEASIFYFAGHGFQFKGENYLASTDCNVAFPTDGDCKRTCIRLTELLDIYKENSGKIHLVIIDACRRSFDRGSSTTFTSIQAPKGTLIAFSTSANEGAKDHGPEGHSIYTSTLLKYIGRERLSVEELFKKVRKTVYNLTSGTQTTWEHTSLIGDFYFNTGQLVYDVDIPYDESVVKDSLFTGKSDLFSKIIAEMKTYNYYHQNDAMEDFSRITPKSLDKNQLFLMGRNILQASSAAYGASDFLKDKESLARYTIDGENHLFNGILFEIYFDSHASFRTGKFKKYNLETIFALRHSEKFQSSFRFIATALEQYKDELYYVPSDNDQIIDVDILASEHKRIVYEDKEETIQIIEKIAVGSNDITSQISSYNVLGKYAKNLKDALTDFLVAPEALIQIHESIPLTNVSFEVKNEEGAISKW
jgi:hypothetical protein